MLNNFIYAKKKSLFTKELEAGNVLDEAIVFIEDTKEIWNHGTYFDCKSADLSNIEESVNNILSNKIGTGLLVNDGKIELTQQVLTNLGLGEPLPFDGICSLEISEEDLLDTSETLEGYSILYSAYGYNGFIYYGFNDNIYKTFPGYEKYSKELNPYLLFIYNGVLYKHGKGDNILQRLYSMDDIGDINSSLKLYLDSSIPDGSLITYEVLLLSFVSRVLFNLSYTDDKSVLFGEPRYLELLEFFWERFTVPIYGFSIIGESEIVPSVYTYNEVTVTTSLGTYVLYREEDSSIFSGSLIHPNIALDQKQDILISGENIKTINGQSILGSGDITISDGGNNGDLSNYVTKTELAAVATSGSYNDLTNKPTIPSAVTESTVSGWGFTKNTGTYSKPSGGIPKSDLTSAVQTSLGKADTALQSYTEQYKGTVTGVKINGTTKSPSNGVVDLGTVVTSHQDITGKQDKLVSGTNVKTINGESILGSGNITISGGSSSGSNGGGNGAYAEVSHGTSDTTFTLTPNTFHVWDEVSSLTLTLGEETTGVANEYLFQFTSGSEPTVLTLPDSIVWANDETPVIESNSIYQVSVLKGFATLIKFVKSIILISINVGNETFQAEKGMTWDNFVYSKYNPYAEGTITTKQKFILDADGAVKFFSNDWMMYYNLSYNNNNILYNELIIDNGIYTTNEPSAPTPPLMP